MPLSLTRRCDRTPCGHHSQARPSDHTSSSSSVGNLRVLWWLSDATGPGVQAVIDKPANTISLTVRPPRPPGGTRPLRVSHSKPTLCGVFLYAPSVFCIRATFFVCAHTKKPAHTNNHAGRVTARVGAFRQWDTSAPSKYDNLTVRIPSDASRPRLERAWLESAILFRESGPENCSPGRRALRPQLPRLGHAAPARAPGPGPAQAGAVNWRLRSP